VDLDPFGFLMVDRAQTYVALGRAESRFGLRQLKIPAPELGGVGFCAVGSQQIDTFGKQ
jgi:hypothetical protein